MQEIARERQMTIVETILQKRQVERVFLAERCEQAWLTAEQRTTIREKMRDLEVESQFLRWIAGLLPNDPHLVA